MGIIEIATVFRKGEFIENGIATPDMQYYPWSGYKAYTWMENIKKKTAERFSLSLEGGQNWDFTIHGFSDGKKDILDGILSTKLKNRSPVRKG